MKISVIRDDQIPGKALGFLFYYEQKQRFFIEVPGNVDEWEAPLILSSMIRRGITSIDAYWSSVWVQQRIVPVDRQNLGQILRDNGLKEYNPYRLLMLGHGRCAQDSCFVQSVTERDLPDEIRERRKKKVESVVPITDSQLLVGFRDSTLHIIEKDFCCRQKRRLMAYFQALEAFRDVSVEVGGNGLTWGENLNIPAEVLYQAGGKIDLTRESLRKYITHEVITTSEACRMLGCSRQYINELVQKGRLHPLKSEVRNRLFWRSEIEA